MPKTTGINLHWIETFSRQLINFTSSLAILLIKGENEYDIVETPENVSWLLQHYLIKPNAFKHYENSSVWLTGTILLVL